MSDAVDAIVDIQEALAEYGSTITLNIITAGVYSTTTGQTTDTVVSVVTKAILNNYSSKEISNTSIYAKDIKFMLYYNGVVDYTDTIVFDGKTYSLVNIDKSIMQDTNLIYTIQGRL